MAQTRTKTRESIRTGSAKIEIGRRRDELIDIGACRSISVKETVTTSDVESDNAGVVATIVSEHKLEISCDSLEINLSDYAKIRGGLDKIKEYDGKTEIDKKYNIVNDTYELNSVITVPEINADSSPIVISKVELENSYGVKRDLTSITDYEAIGTNAIKLISTDINPRLDIIIIHYKHTPNKMVKLTTGGGDAKIKPQWLVITNTNAYGQKFKIICPQASVSGGLEFPFPADVSTDVMINKFTFVANAAVTEDAYEQLAWFEDEQIFGAPTDFVKVPTEPTNNYDDEVA